MWLEVHLSSRAVAQERSIVDWGNNTAEYYPNVSGDAVGVSVKDTPSQSAELECRVRVWPSLTQSSILSWVRILSATSSCMLSSH
jgi:hypothetical protein